MITDPPPKKKLHVTCDTDKQTHIHIVTRLHKSDSHSISICLDSVKLSITSQFIMLLKYPPVTFMLVVDSNSMTLSYCHPVILSNYYTVKDLHCNSITPSHSEVVIV